MSDTTPALARELTDEQWASHFRAETIRKAHPGLVPTKQDAALLAYVRELAVGLTEPQARRLSEFADDFGFGGRGGGVVLRSLEAKRLARPAGRERWNLRVEVLPLGRAVLWVLEAG